MNKFSLAIVIAACIVGIQSHDPAEPPSAESNVPFLKAGQPVTIKGDHDKIYVNGVLLYDNDQNLKEGNVLIRLSKDGLYINKKPVFKQDPKSPVITENPNINAENVLHFDITIDSQGQAMYDLKTQV